jgi:catalase
MAEGDLYEQIIAAVDGVEGPHEGRRALHSKGSWYEGTFIASPRAAKLSRAFHLQGEPVAALIRFSNASGNPDANDGAREGRGFAVKLRTADAETDILATTSVAFVTRTPEDFLELMRLRRPDPETGQPDFEKLGAWLGEHPETQPAIQSTLGADPLASFATTAYFSPHTFFLVDADGTRTAVRYRWIPDAGEGRITDEEAAERGRDYLHSELGERLAIRPVAFGLRLQLAADDDPLDDATAVWPDEREQVEGGRLEIERAVADPERDDHIEVFDPLRLVDGVEPSDDPILHARRAAYSVSAYRRWGRPPGPPPGE